MDDNQQQYEATLSIALDELRSMHKQISEAHDHIRSKSLSMIAGEIAIITFLFSGEEQSRIKIPVDTSGVIFLSIGVICMLAAFSLLLSSIIAGSWYLPGDLDEIQNIYDGQDDRYSTTLKFILYLRSDYLLAVRKCINIVSRKAKRTNWGLYLLSAGAIILLIIKYGGRHIS